MRNGQPGGTPPRSTGPDVVPAMATERWLDFVGIGLDPKKAEDVRFTFNLITPDNGEKFVVELSNATLTTLKGFQAPKPDMTVTLNRSDLNQVMMGVASFDDLIAAGKARFGGNRQSFDRLCAILVPFTPDFEIMLGTAPIRPAPAPKPFELTVILDED